MRFRNHGMRRIPAMLVAAALFCLTGASQAEADKVTVNIGAGKQIFLNGKGDVPACQTCHGPKGLGDDGMQTPRLANIGYAYVVKQLTNIADDARVVMTNPMMNIVAKGLTEQDRKDVAAYLNTLEPAVEPSDLAALKAGGTEVGEAYKGQILVRYGIIGKAPACQSCHGFNGRGSDPVYPQIGQQKYVYLVNQLKSWRDGSRTNDPLGQMRAVAKNLTDEDIINAAAYLTRAPKSTPGDGFLPNNQSVLGNLHIVQ
jgi:cytochrome c553